ncbi:MULTISPECIES: cell division protein ZapE [Burkholderiaceae]|jgi:cell division protein ZapE|uniref:ATPase component BioM of energizing module of biotin ECF transporter n=1 Tax=Caballeronia sordidicola TaxID=196367 RepID=A0A242MDI6_CABSO|nr:MULTISPECIES: cell division protein ZapE [Burkholderiaceae]MDP9155426.1 cell division protein ZapE [Pseudomonadota bacterium]AME24932.1 ATPase [Burkholderia sp. PAMC 26561]AMM15510.1 ATPase [Burkholderia sp. PAMC 28687]OTP69348.1 ATPase component BioM of energizing module of biotin ECF transporter [Caballeronia sordidicola]OTP72496.1 ATPase component BioM of energizing module of biotin ECF transporter [Caballeronia sordidicola]
MNVTEYYEHELETRGYQSDAAQLAAVERLQRCYDEWVAYKARRSNAFKKLISRPDLPRGVYMWGGVGRGKSFLMDSFFAVVPVQRKTRLHFHEFMREVHRELEELKGTADPLDELARRVAKRYRLICFDEFHVSDIADAMILYRLLDRLFGAGVQFVMTSNYDPDLLYPDGLHRDRLLPAIELIKSKLDVINVDAGTDYRKRTLSQVKAYHTPLGAAADQALRADFAKLAAVPDESPILRIEKRELKALRKADGVVWFDFATLCGGPRSQNDYLELASRFHAVILSEVPKMSPRNASEARRFTWLIDVFYDHKVKLLMSAEVPAEELYVEGPMANEFARTVSRITEMQSKEYLESERRLVDTSLT